MRNVIMKHKEKIDKITNFLLNILIFIFALILLISIYVGIQTKVMKNNYANFFGYSLFEVQTGSMADAINAGDWIIVKITKDIELDDVITYKHGDEFITHRVKEIYNGTYVTKGDANNAKDDPIDQSDVVGKVSVILGDLGILRATIFNPAVLIALIVTLFLFNMALGKKNDNKKELPENINKLLNNIKSRLKSFIELLKSKEKELRDKILEKKKQQKSIEVKPVKKEIKEEVKPVLQKVTIENDELEIEEKEEKEELDDLEKTMYFRMINIDGKPVEVKEQEETSILDDEPEVVEDMDKTTFFRMISVNEDEVSDTLNEVAVQEAKTVEKPKEEIKKVVKKPKIKKPVDESKIKKGKNIIDTVLVNKEDELNEIINLFIVNQLYDKKQVIRKTLMKRYIRAKYYNIYDDTDVKYNGKDSVTKIRKVIKVTCSELENTVDDKIKQDIHFYLNAFNAIVGIENTRDATDNDKARLASYKKEIGKYFQWNKNQLEYLANKILSIQENYEAIVEKISDKLDTNMFDLVIKELSKANMYAVDIEHNINFSKVYSDYIIDKTYENGVVNEDKVLILISLLLTHLLKEMVDTNFNKEYVFDMPSTLYKKPRKFKKILRMLEDEYVKQNTIMFITLEDLTDNLNVIKDIKKQGYKVATLLNNEDQFKVKNRRILGVANYIFVDKTNIKLTNLKSYLNEDLKPKIIYDDIVTKIGGNN